MALSNYMKYKNICQILATRNPTHKPTYTLYLTVKDNFVNDNSQLDNRLKPTRIH